MENLEEKKTKKSTGKTIIIIFLIIMVLGLGGFIVYDKVLSKPVNDSNKTNEEVTTKDEAKEKVLDVNGRLVQELYNSVVEGDVNYQHYYKYWVYDDNGEFDVTTADEKTKMNIVSLNLNSSYLKIASSTECLELDQTLAGTHGLQSACYYNSLHPTEHKITYYYDKSYVELIYKKMFGSDAKLDTSAIILNGGSGLSAYGYNGKYNAYFEYIGAGGGTSNLLFKSTITKAISTSDTIKIYENVIAENPYDNMNPNANYVYTFKLDSKDNLYNFISRKTVK